MGHYRKQMVSVLLTTRCNLRCTYCITSCNHFEELSIDPRFARRGMADYFQQAPSPQVRFTALGEPTQRMDLLRQLHADAVELSGGKARFELQTNGTFDEQTAHWIADNFEVVWISFDGLPEVHDQLKRTGSGEPTSGRILRNLEILQERAFVGFRATITSLNVARQPEIIRFAKDRGVKAVFSKELLIITILTQWLAKTAYEVAVTPLTYLVVNFLKRKEGVDMYDHDTRFNPFSILK